MHKVRVMISIYLKPPSYGSSSNLTFGAGGKDKDGNNVTGWGYYEV